LIHGGVQLINLH